MCLHLMCKGNPPRYAKEELGGPRYALLEWISHYFVHGSPLGGGRKFWYLIFQKIKETSSSIHYNLCYTSNTLRRIIYRSPTYECRL